MTELGLKERISKIEARNRRVETDKAWELSKMRRLLLAFFTYLAIATYLSSIGIPNALLNAVVPTIAFMLSTLTLPYFKKVWTTRIYNAS